MEQIECFSGLIKLYTLYIVERSHDELLIAE